MTASLKHDSAGKPEHQRHQSVMSHRDFSTYMAGLDTAQRHMAVGRIVSLAKTLQGIRDRIQSERQTA